MPIFSIIVPIYNVEKFLPLSLDSLRDQTVEDIEIICVNDGSTDRSKEIADLYAQADDRIRVIDKKNGGVCSARNVGIKAATGTYLCFVDPDDLILPETCELILNAFRETEADVVTFGATCYPDFCYNGWIEEMSTTRDIAYDGFSPDILFKEHSHPFACRTSVKRSLLEEAGILFDEDVTFGEDMVFQFALYPRAKRVTFLKDKLYLYRISREGSFTATCNDDYLGKLKEHCRLVTLMAADLQSLGLMEQCCADYLNWSVEFLIPSLDQLSAERRPEVFECIKESWSTWFGNEAAVMGSLDGEARNLAAMVYGNVHDDEHFVNAVKRYYDVRIPPMKPPFRQRVKNALRRVLPRPLINAIKKLLGRDASASQEEDHAEWYAADALRCQQSLEHVRQEAAQKAAVRS